MHNTISKLIRTSQLITAVDSYLKLITSNCPYPSVNVRSAIVQSCNFSQPLYVTVRQTLLAAAAAATVNARSVCWRLPFTGENVILARLPKSVSVVRWPYGAIALCGRMQSNLTFATFPHLCLLLTNAKKMLARAACQAHIVK